MTKPLEKPPADAERAPRADFNAPSGTDALRPGHWHASSLELSRGLEVTEMGDTLPNELSDLIQPPGIGAGIGRPAG